MNRTRFGLIAGLMAMLLLFYGCSQNDSVDSVSGATQKGESQSSVDSTDTTSSASLYFYEQGSLTGEELMTAIRNAEGSCSVATVNADGSPNLANFVPSPAGEEYLAFTYYIYDTDAEDKYERNQGARFKVEPVTDEAVIAQLHEETPEIPQGATFVHIVEVLPLG